MRGPLGAVLVCALCSSCAPKPVVAIKSGYDFAKLGPVSLLPLKDAPRQAGSGNAVAEALGPFLMKAGYELVERGQVDKLLREQSFAQTGAADPQTAAAAGKILGVKAVILGSVTVATQAASETYMRTVQNLDFKPVYQNEQYVGRDGQVKTRRRLSEYDVVTTKDQIPVTFNTPALIAFSVRLVDTTSGVVLWTGTVSDDGDSLAQAASSAAGRLLKALKKAWPVQS